MSKGRRRANRTGSIYKRADGRWSGELTVREADGVERRQYVYGKTRAEVEAKLSELRAKADSGVPITPGSLTVERYLAEWLDQIVGRRVRPNTLAAYRYNADKYLIPDLGSTKLGQLGARDLRLYLDSLRRRGIGVRTIQYVHSTLRAALEDAVREELLAKNVAKLVRVPREERPERVPLTVEEIRALLKATRDDRLHAMFVTLALIGLRRSELLGLRWEDVDLVNGVLTVRRGLHRVAGVGLETMPTKTLRSRRSIPLPETVRSSLEAHLGRQELERRALAENWPDLGFVFTSPIGTPIDPRNCTRFVQEACKKAGVRVVRMHDFRHGAVSVLLGLGVPPRTVMDIAGHSGLDMTMNVYGHVTLDDKRDALVKLGDLFEEGSE
jgi:integrase